MFSLIGGLGDFITICAHLGSLLVSLVKFILFMPLFLVFAGIMMIATFAEMTFKKISGIDTIYLNGEAFGGANSDGKDLVYAFITDSAVQDVFWSIIGLSIVLLFVFTIVALIRAEFTIDLKGSAKGPIFSRAFKSLVNLLVIPVVTLISIFATNFLTKTIYDMFGTDDVSIVTKCFHVGAYNANKVRSNPFFADKLRGDVVIESGNPFTGYSSDADLANAVDKAFLDYRDANIAYKQYGLVDICRNINEGVMDSEFLDQVFFGAPAKVVCFSLFKLPEVAMYYNLFKFDWILAIGTGIVITWIMLSVCLVLVKRVFELTILFLLAPPMTAIAPLDGGQAEKKWRGEFMKRLLAVIAPIFAYNMYFLMVPLFENISLFGAVKMAVGSTSGVAAGATMLGSYQVAITDFLFIFDIFFQLICVIVGLSILKSASALLSNLLGVEDLVKSGGEAAKKAVDVGKKAALGATSIAVKGSKVAIGTAKKIKAAKEARKNAKETAADREKAKAELPEAEQAMNDAKDQATASEEKYNKANEVVDRQKAALEGDSSYQRAKKYLEDHAEGADQLEGSEKAAYEQAQAQVADKEKTLRAAERGRDILKKHAERDRKAYDEKKTAYEERESGISSEKSKELAALRSDKNADGSAKTEEQKAADLKKVEDYENKLSNIDVKAAKKRAWETEFGKDSHEESFFAKKFAKGTKLGDFMDKSLFGRSMKEMLNPEDNEAFDRRWKDALSGLFGDGGGGDLWKIYFNKNARAGLYEGVPESKKRSTQIETNLSFAARENFSKSQQEKEARAAEEKNIRRMMAEERGGLFAEEYKKLYDQIEKGDQSPTQIKKLEAKIEKMEIDSGIKSAARNFYDAASTPGSEQGKKLADFKEKMQADAAQRSILEEEKAKQKTAAAYAATHDGKVPETKITEQSSEQLAKAIERALSGGKGLKLNKDGATVEIKGLKETLENINGGLESLSVAIQSLKEAQPGTNNNSTSGTKPGGK